MVPMTEVEDRLQRALGTRVRQAEGAWRSYKLMKRFPYLIGSIDWKRARQVSERHAHEQPPADSGHDPQHVVAFLDECSRKHNLTDEWVAFVGYSFDHEWEVERAALPELLALVSDVADHKYIFALDASWCSMWSFRDELYFGFPPERD